MFRLTPSSYPILTVKARMAHVSGSVDTEKRQLVYLADTDLVNESLEGQNSPVACKVRKAGIIEVTFLLLYLSYDFKNILFNCKRRCHTYPFDWNKMLLI